jgi:hypothetical protein
MSYWHASWIDELPLEKWNRTFIGVYWRMNNSEVPPENDDGSTDAESGQIANQEKESDPLNLEMRFYRYGVKPEWMQIHRVVNHHQVLSNAYKILFDSFSG